VIVGLNLLYLLPGMVGGTETYAAGLLYGLASTPEPERFIVFVNLESADWPLPDDPRIRRVVCPVRAASRAARYWYEQVRLPARVAAENIDLLHSLGYVAPLRLSCPSVLTVHDVHHLAHGRRSDWPRRLVLARMIRQSVRRAAAVIADSRFTRDAVASSYDVSADAIDVVPLAPNPRLCDDGSGFGPPPAETGPYLLAFGGVTPNKNLARLLEAYALARERHGLNQNLVLVGHVPASVGGEGTTGVRTTGYLPEPELARWLAHADALVFPSLYEGFGLPVLEAMAAGVPVVCSAVTAIPEVAGDAAVYFDPRDPEDMAAKMALVGRDEALRAHLAAAGRARAGKFSWDRSARQTLAVYRRVLDHRLA
jgi:glycosyltransferase involved in cell wall biosynthesis